MLLEVENLNVSFDKQVLFDVSFSIRQNSCLGVVGESGSGKSITASSLMGLIPFMGGQINSGRIRLLDSDLSKDSDWNNLRGKDIAMVFQDPMTALNPLLGVGTQIAEVMQVHKGMSKKEARNKSEKLMKTLGLLSPELLFKKRPYELSGGMRQRIVVAMALAADPKVLIADEPTTALDVTVQSQMLGLLQKIQKERSLGVLFISHDLPVILEMADEILVMYKGRVLEYGSANLIFKNPLHDYTKHLLSQIPDPYVTSLPENNSWDCSQVEEQKLMQAQDGRWIRT
jgi:ABC-type dipeptide/oligopeptide/nickel transport system ATPase component